LFLHICFLPVTVESRIASSASTSLISWKP